MRYLTIFSLIIILISCSVNPKITEFEPTLISDQTELKTPISHRDKINHSVPATLMRATYLMEKPAKWSSNNKPVIRQKLPIGAHVLIKDTLDIDKKSYLKIQYKKHEGWASNWRIIPNSEYSLVIEETTLFTKADITSFTSKRLEPGHYICLDSIEVGDFRKICFLEREKDLKSYWIESGDINNTSTDTIDFQLFPIYKQLKDSSTDRVQLLTEIELLKPSVTSPLNQKIIQEFGTLDSLDNYLEELYNDSSLLNIQEESNLNY